MLALAPLSVFAQTDTPVEVVEGAVASSNTVWAGVAGLSATAFVFGMLIAFARKGKK